MLAIGQRDLVASAAAALADLQAIVNAGVDYPARVAAAKAQWAQKGSATSKATAFRIVRATLAEMCVGPIRCAYCEDSLADEIEHVAPKTLFPERTFDWLNYVYACGPCNGPKSNQYGVVTGAKVVEFVRRRGEPIVPPPSGTPGFIDPRTEDPLLFFELDMGGVTASGEAIEGTFELLPVDGLSAVAEARARFTIRVLGLNREVIRVARANAYGGFRARLREYADQKAVGAPEESLDRMKLDLLSTPHLTVFAEMRRQRMRLPEIHDLFTRVPEATVCPLVR
jgi:hypothetical protein